MKKVWILFFFLQAAIFAANIDKVRVFEDSDQRSLVYQTSDYSEASDILKTIGVRLEKWEIGYVLPSGSTSETILEAYKNDVEKLKQENGYKSVDVVRMVPDSPKREELRKKFLNEHTHSEDEVRFFVEGCGLFYLHVTGKVFIVLCEAGDLISIPANYTHWFDMGDKPFFTAIRLFIEPDGWIARFTESGISQFYPKFGD